MHNYTLSTRQGSDNEKHNESYLLFTLYDTRPKSVLLYFNQYNNYGQVSTAARH